MCTPENLQWRRACVFPWNNILLLQAPGWYNCTFPLLFYNIPKYWMVLKMGEYDIKKNLWLHFLKTPKVVFFIPPPNNHHPPTIHSLSFFTHLVIIPCACVSCCICVVIWLTALGCNLAFLFHSFHLSFSPLSFFFPPTLLTYFMARHGLPCLYLHLL